MVTPDGFARQADCSINSEGGTGVLWYPQEFENYTLKLDWKMNDDDNSGVFVGPDHPGSSWTNANDTGYEVQVDATDDPGSTTGAIYKQQPPDEAARDAALKPPVSGTPT